MKRKVIKQFEHNGRIYVGRHRGQELIVADDRTTAPHYHMYDLIDASMMANDESYIRPCGWWDVKPEDVTELTERDRKAIEVAWDSDSISFCGGCGIGHDTDEPYEPTFRFTKCAIYCHKCVPVDELLGEFNKAEDLFKAPQVESSSIPDDVYEEVDTLFCDSSGFGGPGERALTKEQAEEKAAAILQAHKSSQLFVGLTGVGQFQVYVTIYKKVDVKKSRKVAGRRK